MKRHLGMIASLWIAVSLLTGPAAIGADTVQVPGVEGLTLATDLYLPGDGKAPAILIRTPYGRQGMAFVAEAFVEAGYAVAVQDVRGRYGSDGRHEPFRHERADGLATLRWMAAQKWCNGRIGMWGSSYSGHAALVLADAEFKPLQSIFSISGWTASDQVVRPGGATHLQLNLPWMLTQQGRVQRNLNEFDVDALFRHTPLRDALKAAGIRNPTWEDPAWIDRVARRKTGSVTRPVFHVTGWHDMVYPATLDAWRALSRHAKAPQKLAIGPWYHNQMLFESFDVGDARFGEASGFGTAEMTALALRWFDATLRGRKNGILDEPPVSFFVMGHDAWQHESAWPPPESAARPTRWYLDGAAPADAPGGGLATTPPRSDGSQTFVFDPDDPVPTFGGAVFFYFPEVLGVRDQREIERRDDVLVFTSPPLTEELQITGRLRAHLHVATSAPDTDFTAKLVTVRPDGYARIVEEGIVRVSATGQTIEPGTPFEVDIDLGHTAIAVPAGERLRVEISSSNFPKYDRNPNTGADPFTATEFATARQTVFHTTDRASYIELPVRRRPLVVTAASRRPLIRPVAAAPATATVVGSDASELLTRGRAELERDEVDQAIATLSRAVELNPEGPAESLWLGRAYLAKLQSASMFRKLGLSKKVRTHFRRAVELSPEDVEARTSLANFYFQAPGVAGGSFSAGQEQVEHIRKLDPKAAHLLMAGAHRGRGEPEEAEREYRAYLATAPDDGQVWYRLGLMLQTEKRWDAAFDAFEQGAGPGGDPASLYQVGRTAVFSGRQLERGKRALEQYIEQRPEGARMPSPGNARWRLGMILEQMGRKDLARRQYETALADEPDLDAVREALEKLSG